MKVYVSAEPSRLGSRRPRRIARISLVRPPASPLPNSLARKKRPRIIFEVPPRFRLETHFAAYPKKDRRETRPEWHIFPFGKPQPADPTRRGTTFKTAWRKVKGAARVNRHWHDNRHTFVTTKPKGARRRMKPSRILLATSTSGCSATTAISGWRRNAGPWMR